MKIICISGKARHGKDTAAGYIREALEDREEKVLTVHMADLLKYICKSFFGWNGMKDEAGRTLLQYVGTDKIRRADPDFLVNFVASVLGIFDGEWDWVIIPDCRFPNEIEVLRKAGFDVTTVRVRRPGFQSGLTPDQLSHPSETAMDGYVFDHVLINGGSLQDLKRDVIYLVGELYA